MTGPAPSRFDRWASRFLPEGSSGVDRELRLYLAFVFVLFVPTTLALAGLDWARGERTTGVLVGAISLILISSLGTLRRAGDIRWGYRVVLGSALVLLTGVVWFGGGGGYALVWYYGFPAGFYYVFGAREGSVWVAALLAPCCVILFTPLGAGYPPALTGRFVLTYLLVAALALGLQRARDAYAAELLREQRLLEEALAKVRTLSEMLPMCAWCGKVRDDEGYWTRIEEYLRQETGTQITHGMCNDCAVRLLEDLPPPVPGSEA